MAAANPTVGLAAYFDENAIITYILSGVTDSTAAAAAVGYAVTLDTSAAGTVKLATDGSEVYGRIESAEYRAAEGVAYASVALRFIGALPLKTGETPAIGSQIVGAGDGTVKARTALTYDPTLTVATSMGFILGQTVPNKVLTYDGTAHTVTVRFNF